MSAKKYAKDFVGNVFYKLDVKRSEFTTVTQNGATCVEVNVKDCLMRMAASPLIPISEEEYELEMKKFNDGKNKTEYR